MLCDNFNIKTVPDLLCIISKPYHLLEHCTFSQCRELCCFINIHIEPACRALIYRLHTKRYYELKKKQTLLRKKIYNHSAKDVMGLMCLVPELRSSWSHIFLQFYCWLYILTFTIYCGGGYCDTDIYTVYKLTRQKMFGFVHI